MKYLMVLYGLPASEKTTWIVKKNNFQAITVCRDAIRRQKYGDIWSPGIAATLDSLEGKELNKLLREYPVVIADGCHMDWKRLQYPTLQMALHGHVCNWRRVDFIITPEESIARQARRPENERVPAEAILQMAAVGKKWPRNQPPVSPLTPDGAAKAIKKLLEGQVQEVL